MSTIDDTTKDTSRKRGLGKRICLVVGAGTFVGLVTYTCGYLNGAHTGRIAGEVLTAPYAVTRSDANGDGIEDILVHTRSGTYIFIADKDGNYRNSDDIKLRPDPSLNPHR